jgi:hypothetical protein
MTLRKILGGGIIVGGNLVCEAFRRPPVKTESSPG